MKVLERKCAVGLQGSVATRNYTTLLRFFRKTSTCNIHLRTVRLSVHMSRCKCVIYIYTHHITYILEKGAFQKSRACKIMSDVI